MENIVRWTVVIATVLPFYTVNSCSVADDCADNAHCDNGKCRCNAGHNGIGSFLCVPEETSCACISYGDPHIYMFERYFIDYVFPCTHTLAQYTTTNCGPVLVYATSERRGKGIAKVFEAEVFWFIQKGSNSYSGYIKRDGIYVNSARVALPSTLGDATFTIFLSRDARGYFSVSAPVCNTHVTFHPRGVVTVSAPKDYSQIGYSACGTCRGSLTLLDWGKRVFNSSSLSVKQKKAVQLVSELESTIDSNDALCSNLSRATDDCMTDVGIALAAEACSELVNRFGVFRKCLDTFGMPNKALESLSRCVKAHCAGEVIKVCKELADFGLECDPPVRIQCEN